MITLIFLFIVGAIITGMIFSFFMEILSLFVAIPICTILAIIFIITVIVQMLKKKK